MRLPEAWSFAGREKRGRILRKLPVKVLGLLAIEWCRQILLVTPDQKLRIGLNRAEKFIINPTPSVIRRAHEAAETTTDNLILAFDNESEVINEVIYGITYEEYPSADLLTAAVNLSEDLAETRGWHWLYDTYRQVKGPGIEFKSEWKTDTAVGLARNIFKTRNLKNMPILADALQDAGCDHEEIIAHLQRHQCCLFDWCLWNLLDLK